MKEKFLAFALRSGILVPLLYFGTQLLAAPFFPGYSFVSMVASLLGSDLAPYPFIFNLGAMLTGIATILASIGFFLALPQLGTHRLLTWLTSLALLLNGAGSLWAGFFPLPDPRHGANPFTVGIFLFPILLLFALWKQPHARPLKAYLILTNLLFIVFIPIMSGVSGLNTQGYQGLLQRIVALIFFVPISAGSYFLMLHIKQPPSSDVIKHAGERTV